MQGELGVNEQKARRLLKRIGAVSRGGRKNARWFSTEAVKNLEGRQESLPETTDNQSEDPNDGNPW